MRALTRSDVYAGDDRFAGQVSNGPGQLQNPLPAARRETELAHRTLEQRLCGFIETAALRELPIREPCIANSLTVQLDSPRSRDDGGQCRAVG